MSNPTQSSNNFIVILWGAHGSGKTTFLEESSRTFKDRFIPIFGDLYGNKHTVEEKKRTVGEFLEVPYPLIIEGKRYFDHTIFSSIEQLFESSSKEIIIVITTSTVDDSVRRINERRKNRNQSTNWVYPQKGEYEVKNRFLNKLRSLYTENPLFWSRQTLVIQDITSDFAESWKPIKQMIHTRLLQVPPSDFFELNSYPIVSEFLNLFNKNYDQPFVKGGKVQGGSFDLELFKQYIINS